MLRQSPAPPPAPARDSEPARETSDTQQGPRRKEQHLFFVLCAFRDVVLFEKKIFGWLVSLFLLAFAYLLVGE